MAKNMRLKVLAGSAVFAAGVLLLSAGQSGSNAMEPAATDSAKAPTAPLSVTPARALPAIDLAAPKKIETATFALG